MSEQRAHLEALIERRNAVAMKRNELIAEVDRLGAEVEVFDKQIKYAAAARIAESDENAPDDL